MRKIIAFTVVLMILLQFTALSATFAPTPLKLSSDNILTYSFDGSNLTVPVAVEGAPSALVKFFVYTKNKASEVIKVRNGYLGWHYMDKVDTCVFMSTDNEFVQGNQSIIWNGKDQDDGVVAAGDYTFYLWGFDNKSSRTRATPVTSIDPQSMCEVQRWDPSGNVLAQPFIHQHTWRWTLGNDPENTGLFETCSIQFPASWGACYSGDWAIQPDNFSIIYPQLFNSTTKTAGVYKYNWVPNDIGSVDSNFNVQFGTLNYYLNQEHDNQYIFLPESNYKETTVRSRLHIVDYRVEAGEYLGYIEQSAVFESVDDYNNPSVAGNKLMNNGMSQSVMIPDGSSRFVGGNHCACLRVMVEPLEFFEDSSSDCIRWQNDNGDFIFDNNWEPTSTRAWVCTSLGSNHSNHGWGADKNAFIELSNFFSVLSFEAGGPDGKGIGKYSYAGEVDQSKCGMVIIDTDTAYDGAFSQNTGEANGAAGLGQGGFWWIGRDSFKGTITSQSVNVADAPAAFDVAQNTPNPFNPTTAISFTTSGAGSVKAEVFNIAGQKVATLLNGYRNAGRHTLTWNAAGNSAGVYFCTISAGAHSRTIKMTLAK